MAKNKQNKGVEKKKNVNSKPIGYYTKGIPKFILSYVFKDIIDKKSLKSPLKSNWRVHPIAFIPDDIFLPKSNSKKFFFQQKCQRSDSAYRFRGVDISLKYRRLTNENYKEYSERLSQMVSERLGKTPRLVVVMTPHNVVTGKVVGIGAKCDVIIGAIKPKSVRENAQFHFYDNINPVLYPYYTVRYSQKLYPVDIVIDGQLCMMYSQTPRFKIGGMYDFLVTGWGKLMVSNRGDTISKPTYYNWKSVEVKETYFDIYNLINNIKSFKPFYPNWCYDDDTNEILLSSVMYLQKNVPCMNLVFFSPTRCGKTRTLEVFSNIFGDVVHSGSMQTVRGIVGSFTDENNMGAMMESKYVFLGDEFFRTELGNDKNKTLDAKHLDFVMSKTIELLEHSDKMATSGNFSRSQFFNKSFIAMNNIRDLKAFGQAFANDPALFMRFSFMTMKDREINRVKNAYISPDMYINVYKSRINKIGFNLKTTAKLFRLMRNSLSMVKVPNKVFHEGIKRTDFVHTDYDKRERFMSLIKARTIMNYVINNPKPFPMESKISPTQQDIDEAVQFCNRLSDGFRNVVGLP